MRDVHVPTDRYRRYEVSWVPRGAARGTLLHAASVQPGGALRVRTCPDTALPPREGLTSRLRLRLRLIVMFWIWTSSRLRLDSSYIHIQTSNQG